MTSRFAWLNSLLERDPSLAAMLRATQHSWRSSQVCRRQCSGRLFLRQDFRIIQAREVGVGGGLEIQPGRAAHCRKQNGLVEVFIGPHSDPFILDLESIPDTRFWVKPPEIATIVLNPERAGMVCFPTNKGRSCSQPSATVGLRRSHNEPRTSLPRRSTEAARSLRRPLARLWRGSTQQRAYPRLGRSLLLCNSSFGPDSGQVGPEDPVSRGDGGCQQDLW